MGRVVNPHRVTMLCMSAKGHVYEERATYASRTHRTREIRFKYSYLYLVYDIKELVSKKGGK